MKTTEQLWAELRKGIPVGHLAVLAATAVEPKSLVPQIQYHRNVMTIQKARTPGKSQALPLLFDPHFSCREVLVDLSSGQTQYKAILRDWIRFQLRSKTKKGPKRKTHRY